MSSVMTESIIKEQLNTNFKVLTIMEAILDNIQKSFVRCHLQNLFIATFFAELRL